MRHLAGLLSALILFGLVPPVSAQEAAKPAIASAASGSHKAKIEAYIKARKAFDAEVEAYWDSISAKRRVRFAKRRSNETVVLDDYVLTQPPVYTGPPRPPGFVLPRDPKRPIIRIPVLADFLKAASEEFQFAPDRPKSDLEFKQAYAKVATAAGLTREQAVRVYAFETGGNGTYDVQAGLTSGRKGARAISPAMGYNQLLSTNTVSLLAGHGHKFVAALEKTAGALAGNERKAMDAKVATLRRMVAFTRTVPNAWAEHDKLAKFTRAGTGIHSLVLDRDVGPLLQTQKLLDSVEFAKMKGLGRPLTAVELEMMNFTGDGNGFDMVLMPKEIRDKVPTSNFFQRGGYERNPIARRTGTVAGLFESIDTKMDRASQSPGARELSEAF